MKKKKETEQCTQRTAIRLFVYVFKMGGSFFGTYLSTWRLWKEWTVQASE